jgi:hypothetical protein
MYLPDEQRYDKMTYAAAARAVCGCPPSHWAFGTTSAARMRWRTCAPCYAAHSNWASPTSTWPTATVRRRCSAEEGFGRALRADLGGVAHFCALSLWVGCSQWAYLMGRPSLTQR